MLTVEQLAEISQNPDPVGYDLKGDVEALVPEMRRVGITTKRRVAAFLANVVVETDRLKTLEEYGDPAYWRHGPSRRPPDMYLGDQWMYHGRGYLQNTWKAAYARLSEVLGVDLVGHPHLLSTRKDLAARAAVWYWTEHDLNSYADRGDFKAVASIINTGRPDRTPNHWTDRLFYYNRAMSVLPDSLGGPTGGGAPMDDAPKRVIIPQTFKHGPTARRVQRQIRQRVNLPPDKSVVIRDAGEGERVVIPQKFTHVPTAIRVRDEIREKVDLPPDKTVVLHTPRRRKDASPGVPEPAPQTRIERMVEEAIEFGMKLIGAPYGNGWREGTWPALSPLYSRITRHDPSSYYDDRECICSGLINILRFEIAELPSVGWDQGDGWPGGTAAIGRHLAFAEGSRPYPPVENTPRGWLVWSPYIGAALALQGHVGVALGNGLVLEVRVPRLSADRTEHAGSQAIVRGGGKPYQRIIPPGGPNGWLVK